VATKNIKLDIGTVYQKSEGGNFYFRYQVEGKRKAISLKTKNRRDAVAKAQSMLPVIKASSVEVVAAHVNEARSWVRGHRRLELSEAWRVYEKHPDRPNPGTAARMRRYQSYFEDFVAWAGEHDCTYMDEVSDELALAYADELREQSLAVDTHNKRIWRVAHVFHTLEEFTSERTCDWRNPSLKRRKREEIGITARRLPFTREQEERLFEVLDDPGLQCPNRDELRVLFHIGAFTGQRLKDCALLQWHSVDLPRRRITIRQYKTGREATIPVAPRLLQALELARGWARDSYVLPNTAQRYLRTDGRGQEAGHKDVNLDVLAVIRATGLKTTRKVKGRGRAVTVYGFHSLRHSFVSFCIDHNIPKPVCISILGADSAIVDQYYTHVDHDAQERAIRLIDGAGATVKQRYDQAVEFLAAIPEEEKDGRWREMERILRG
jgi:integrase